MYEKKLNCTLNFDPQTEGDIVAVIEEQANKRGLKEFLHRAIRYAVAHAADFDKETEYMYGLDAKRTEFFMKYKLGQKEMWNQLNQDQQNTREQYERIEAELEKLYVLAESGRLFGLKQKAELLNIESLLVKHESERIQKEVFKGKRPQITERELEDLKRELPERAENIMVYLIEHYNKELAEFQIAMRPMVIETQGAQAQSASLSPSTEEQGQQGQQEQEPEQPEQQEPGQQEQQELSIPSAEALAEFENMFNVKFDF